VTQPRLYDNTLIKSSRSCLRRHYFRHQRHWVAEGTAPALTFGLSWHSAMDIVWDLMSANPVSDKAYVVAQAFTQFQETWIERAGPIPLPDSTEGKDLKARHPIYAKEMLFHYVEARRSLFADPTFELVGIEKPFVVPLDPKEEVFYVGRFDKVYRKDGKVWIGEHKTTSMYSIKDGFRSSWLDSFTPDSQIDGYLYAANMLWGKEVGGVVVDGALVHKTVHNKFIFIPIDKQFSQVDAWHWEARYWIDQIEANRVAAEEANGAPYMAAWPKNTNACMEYGRSCTYMDLCRMWADPRAKDTPLGYKEEPWSPFTQLGLTPEDLLPKAP
jgi:hypothetical protein